jgi:hypothetical protein
VVASFLLSLPRMDWLTQLPRYAPELATVLVVAGALWIGTLFSVSWLCGRARMMADGPEIGRLAASLFGRWTVPSLLVSLLAGAALWLVAFERQGHARWLYIAAAAEIILIALSVRVGLQARRVGNGSLELT